MRLVDTKEIPVESLQPWPRASALFPRYSSEQVEELNEFTGKHGTDSILPIVISPEYFIIDGYNRYTAALRRGQKMIACQIFAYSNDAEQEIHAIVLNAKRRHLEAVVVARVAARLAELYRPAEADVKKARAEGGKKGGRGNEKPCTTGDVQGLRREPATEKAARELGVSPQTVRAVAKVDATSDPVLIDAMEQKTVSIEKAAQLATVSVPARHAAIQAAVDQATGGLQRVANNLRRGDSSLFIAACIDAHLRLSKGAELTKFADLTDNEMEKCAAALGGVLTKIMELKQQIDKERKA
jgi:hypothetical protein